MTSDDIFSVYARETHNTEGHGKHFQSSNQTWENDLPPLYDGLIPIQKEKKKDLMTMLKFLTNKDHVSFYENLPSA